MIQRIFVPLILLAAVGCAPATPTGSPQQGGTPTAAAKPRVHVKLGLDNLQKARPQLVKGQKLKFKGEIALAGSQGKEVVVHLGELYTGTEPAVQAAALTKDFTTDRAAFEKKYKREKFPDYDIIVEGTIAEVDESDFAVNLAGHEG